jgi:Fe-S cluster assembly ATP-binding protein
VNKILLLIENLKVSVENKIILNGISLNIEQGQIHAIMGPNGSGKSTLANTLMGHPKYKIESGQIAFAGTEISQISADKRARLGLFLAMQNPYEIEGVVLKDFLRQAYNAIYKGTEKELDLKGFKNLLSEKMELLKIKPEFVERFINVGFSGGEKKRAEVLQLAVLQPKLAILDEIDSGLDVDALKIVCDGLNKIKTESKDISFLIITHYPRILHYLKPDFVHVMQHGMIVKSGDYNIAYEIEKMGYK